MRKLSSGSGGAKIHLLLFLVVNHMFGEDFKGKFESLKRN